MGGVHCTSGCELHLEGRLEGTWWLVFRLSICLLKAWFQNCLQMKTTASSSFLNRGASREVLSTRLHPTRLPSVSRDFKASP